MNKLKVEINLNIELLGILSHISSYDTKLRKLCGNIPKSENLLIKNLQKHFKPFKDHKAVEIFNTLTEDNSFIFDAPVALFLSPNDYSESLLLRAKNNRALLESVMESVIQFKKDSNFNSFIQNNSVLYRSTVETLEANLKDKNPIGLLENYTGYYGKSYTLIPAPTLIGNFGHQGFSVLCPVNNKDLFFGDYHHIFITAVHEFLHLYINRLTREFMETNKEINLNHIVDNNMKSQCYVDVQSVMNETIINGIVARLTSFEFGSEVGEHNLNLMLKKGFKYVKSIYNKLKTYEDMRDRYKELKDFYPKLLEVFKGELYENTSCILF